MNPYYKVRVCPCCEVEQSISNAAIVCPKCSALIQEIGNMARAECYRQFGNANKAKGHICVDCQGPATEWDHRRYAYPLDVVPVCRRCNKLRGHAEDAFELAMRPIPKGRGKTVSSE